MVAIGLRMWRPVRIVGAPGSVIGGKCKLREPRGGATRRGGNRLPLGYQQAVGCDAERSVIIEASPTPVTVVSEPGFLLDVLVVAFDAPAPVGEIDHARRGDVLGKGGGPIPRGFLPGIFGHLISNYSASPVRPACRAHA